MDKKNVTQYGNNTVRLAENGAALFVDTGKTKAITPETEVVYAEKEFDS